MQNISSDSSSLNNETDVERFLEAIEQKDSSCGQSLEQFADQFSLTINRRLDLNISVNYGNSISSEGTVACEAKPQALPELRALIMEEVEYKPPSDMPSTHPSEEPTFSLVPSGMPTGLPSG